MSFRFSHLKNLLREAMRQKNPSIRAVPSVCVVDQDGGLVDYLNSTGQAEINNCWACHHTKLYNLLLKGIEFTVLGCAVGSLSAVAATTENPLMHKK